MILKSYHRDGEKLVLTTEQGTFIVNAADDTVLCDQLNDPVSAEDRSDAMLLAFMIASLESHPSAPPSMNAVCEEINPVIANPKTKASWLKIMPLFTNLTQTLDSLSAGGAEVLANLLFQNSGPKASVGVNTFVRSLMDRSKPSVANRSAVRTPTPR